MTRHQLFVGSAALLALILTLIAYDGWLYLGRGYTIAISSGASASGFEVTFPAWRRIAHVALWAASLAALALLVRAHRRAAVAAFLTVAGALALHASDILEYGTLGAPPAHQLPLLLLIALAAAYRRRADEGPRNPGGSG